MTKGDAQKELEKGRKIAHVSFELEEFLILEANKLTHSNGQQWEKNSLLFHTKSQWDYGWFIWHKKELNAK